MYGHIVKGIRILSKCDWYEHGEKLTKFFLILKRHMTIKIKFVSLYFTTKI